MYKYIFIGNVSFICSRRLKFLRDYTWSVYHRSKEARTKGIAGSGKAFLSRTKRFQWQPLWLRCITVVLVTVLLEIEVYCSTLFFCCFTAIHLRFRRSNDNFDRNSINLCAIPFFFPLFCTQILFQLFVYFFLDGIIILMVFRLNDKFYL